MTTPRSEADTEPSLAERIMDPDQEVETARSSDDEAQDRTTRTPAAPESAPTEPTQTYDDDASREPTEPTGSHAADLTSEPAGSPEADSTSESAGSHEADSTSESAGSPEADSTSGPAGSPEADTAPAADTTTADDGRTLVPDPDDRTATQVMPATSSRPDDDEDTRVVPAVEDDPTATRPMPAVDGGATRSTDRDAARARAESRYRPADDSYENLYASPNADGPDHSAAATAAPSGPQGSAAEPEPQVIRRIVRGKPTTDRFHGALALFILRLVVAAVMGAHGAQKLLNLGATREFFGQTQIPYPEWAALATGIGEVLIAGALLIGLLVRVAGLGLLIIAVGALVFVQWAPFTLFRPDVSGFVGEKELVLAAVGLLFLLLGGGGWGADRMFRSAKSKGLVEEDEA